MPFLHHLLLSNHLMSYEYEQRVASTHSNRRFSYQSLIYHTISLKMTDQKLNLGIFPTPVQPLKRLSSAYRDYSIFIKRDDNTGLALGGNKTRKLEYLLQEAMESGCNIIITSGAQQSNHCRQTAAACAIAGLECHLFLGGDEPVTYSGNLLLSKILGANIHFTGSSRKGERVHEYLGKLEGEVKRCYVIPYGGSSITGAMGFVHAVKELKVQLQEQEMNMDYIFFASSSGGMQSGLMLGCELYNMDCNLIGINIDKEETNGKDLKDIIGTLLKEGVEHLELSKRFDRSEINLNMDYDGAGYGVVTRAEQSAIHTLATLEGILLDPVYTGRAFFGMLDYLEREMLPEKSNILFWHTGGLPAIFNYPDLLTNTH